VLVLEGAQHRIFVAAVDLNAADAVTEGIRGAAPGGDGHPVAGSQQALDKEFANEARTADHQYILVHGFPLSDAIYFLLRRGIHQTINTDAMNKKN
jgi:hypothetical protein